LSQFEDKEQLPNNCSVVFFHGDYDPTISSHIWIENHWR
jgi:hypothetical protein